MEAIKQTIDNGTIVFLSMAILGAMGIITVAGLFLFAGKSIITDEPFKVTSDTSSYSCVISEVDADLSLDCLKVK